MRISIFFTAVALTLATTMNAQQSIDVNLNVVSTGNIPTTTIVKGQSFTINSVICDMSNSKGYNYILNATAGDGSGILIDLSRAHKMPFFCNTDNKDTYWYSRCIQYSLPNLASMTNAYALRNKAEASANQTLAAIRKNSLAMEDPYLNAYINSLLVKINPAQRPDFFKYNFKVMVVKDDEPNAGIYPNGALVINAGMLARIHTEDELVAILCHEANHFICNHYLENLSKIQKREVAGSIGSAVLGAAAGILTRSATIGANTAIISQKATDSINALVTAMGLAFDQSQEKESDQAAVDLLPILGYDQSAMATCIKTIGDYYMEEGNLAAYYKSGNHPKIEDRIAATGVPYERRDSLFEKKMAPCVSYVAQVLYNKGRYSQALEFVEQNISNNVGRGIDHYLKGECLLASEDSEASNTAARESLLKALETFEGDLDVNKALIVADIRLGLNEEATELLRKFKDLAKDKPEEGLWADGMLMNVAR